ncbi:rhombotarget lipoprotein [Shewanella sp. C32]|uniref:Rhombotarget lipoprotein n=1 Tax=Shewanella electrica TaxID=515560 RepID=A0ABT2FQ39_9GAMM|nr:rhombotarget lipoprotein [Shewanella electrica]MCH1925724.1 rhombotarget lipoprotein [Shewanella electrica]MCS4558449.1 rhombotarget lipoprotein [Shewanella electrica]
MKLRSLCGVVLLLALSGCSSFFSHQAQSDTSSSSLLSFLYPNHERPTVTTELPLIKLPATVGIAFIPSNDWRDQGVSVAEQMQLLSQVKNQFERYDYIGKIEIIPSTYLQRGRGFQTLEELGQMYDVDIMALVSYNQVRQSTQGKSSLLYWTIVGMYTIPGNENSVNTFVDTAVFDLATHKLLFGANGVSFLSERSTAVGVESTLNDQSKKGYHLAMDDMAHNLNRELDDFKQRVKQDRVAQVENRAGYSGGALGGLALLLLPLAWCRRRALSR